MDEFEKTILGIFGGKPSNGITPPQRGLYGEGVTRWRDTVDAAATEYGVDSDFVLGVMNQESRGREDALSPKGAMGPMQLMPATAQALEVDDPWDPEKNIRGGTKLLGMLVTKYGDKRKALAAYNWGEPGLDRAVEKYGDQWDQHLPDETRDYIEKIQNTTPLEVDFDSMIAGIYGIPMPEQQEPAVPAPVDISAAPAPAVVKPSPVASATPEITKDSLMFSTAPADQRGGTGMHRDIMEPPEMVAERYQATGQSESALESFLQQLESAATYRKDPEALTAGRFQANPVASAIGTGVGMVAPALVGGQAIIKSAQSIPQVTQLVAKYGKGGKAAFDALSRMSIAGGDYTARFHEDLTSKDEAVRNKAIAGLLATVAASGASVAPEILKSGWWQPILQGITGGATNVAAQAVTGENPLAPEAAATTIFQTVLGGVFGLSMAKGAKAPVRNLRPQEAPAPAATVKTGPDDGGPVPEQALKPQEPAKIRDEDIALNRALIKRLEAQAKETNEPEAISEVEKAATETKNWENNAGKDYIWTEGLPIEESRYVKRGTPEELEYQSRLAAIRDEEAAISAAGVDRSPFGKSRAIPRTEPGEQPAAAVERGAVPTEKLQRGLPEEVQRAAEPKNAEREFVDALSEDQISRLTDPTADISDIDFSNAPKGFREEIDLQREENGRAMEAYSRDQEKDLKADRQSEFTIESINKNLGRWDGLSDSEKIVKAERILRNLSENDKATLGIERDWDTGLYNENDLVAKIEDFRSKQYSENSKANAERRRLAAAKKQQETPNIFRQDLRVSESSESMSGFGYDIRSGKYGIDIDALDLQLDAIENKISRGTFDTSQLQQTEINKFPTNNFSEIKKIFEKNPTRALKSLREQINKGADNGAQMRQEKEIETPNQWPEPAPKPGEKRAAIMLNGEVYTGTSHAMAMEKAFKATPKPDPKSLVEGLFVQDGVVLNRDGTPYQTTMKGFEDTRKPYEIEQARLEQERKASQRENPLEGTMFDQNEMEARATKQEDMFTSGLSPEEKIRSMEKEPAATVMGGVKYDPTGRGNLPKYAENINIDRIGSDYDVKRAIHDIAAEYRTSIKENKGPKAPHEETIKLSEQIGLSKEALLNRRRGEVWDRARTLAARDLHIKAVERLIQKKNDLLKKRSDGTVTEQDMLDFLLEEKRVAAIQAEITGLASEAGRLLESFKILSQGKRAKETFEDIRSKIEGGKSTEAILDALSKIDDSDISTISKFIRRANKTNLAEKINRFYIESILSAIPTDEANIAGNVVFTSMRTFLERPATAIAEKFVAPIQGRKPQIVLSETKHEAAGLIDAITPAWKAFVKTLLTGEQRFFPKPTEKLATKSASKLAAFLPTRRLVAEDEFFKTIAFGAKIRAVAYRRAKADGLSGKKMDEKIAEIVKNPELYPEEYAEAWNEAKYRTFTDSPGSITKAIDKIRKAIPLKLGYYVVPFLNTPVKILKAAMERIPVTGEISLAIKASRGLKGKEVSEEIGKLIPSHLIAIPIVALARSGLITGAGPSKKEEKNVWLKTHQPYSVKIGDAYYSYERFDPISSIVGMVADFSMLDMTEENQDQALEIATRIGNSIKQNILNKSFFTQLDALVSAAQEPGKYGERFIANIAGAAVPNIVARGAESVDPYVRERGSFKEIIQARVPGASKDLFPKRDIWGQPIERGKTGIAASISPVRVGKISSEKADKVLNDLKMSVGDPSREIFKVKLNAQQYDDYKRLSGKYAFEEVSRYVESPRFKSVDEERKKAAISDMFSTSRERAASEIIRRYGLIDARQRILSSKKPANELFAELKKEGINVNRAYFYKLYNMRNKTGGTKER